MIFKQTIRMTQAFKMTLMRRSGGEADQSTKVENMRLKSTALLLQKVNKTKVAIEWLNSSKAAYRLDFGTQKIRSMTSGL